jgi:hypothetical protein
MLGSNELAVLQLPSWLAAGWTVYSIHFVFWTLIVASVAHLVLRETGGGKEKEGKVLQFFLFKQAPRRQG